MQNQNFGWDPTAVSNFVVDYANEKGHKLTNLKLQKVLFFLQAAFLVEYNSTLMDVKFSRWQYGPVSSDVYFNFNNNGASQITEAATVLNLEEFSFSQPKIENIPEGVEQQLKGYLDTLLEHSASALVQATHRESIWSDYKKEIDLKMAPDYTNEEIRDYFNQNEEERIWA